MATLESIETQIEELTEHVDEKIDAVGAKIDAVVTAFENQIMHHTCSVCHGDGEVDDPVNGEPGPPYTCPNCGGDGSLDSGYITTTSED